MTKTNIDSALLTISLDRSLRQSLQAQLSGEIRRLAHEQRLTSGDQLPPSRVLARDLSVSRITVTTAYDQLVSEGYLVGRRGSGVFVADDLSGMPPPPKPQKPFTNDPGLTQPEPVRAFESAIPDQTGFPFREWARTYDQVWQTPEPALLGRPDALGWGPLRTAIAGHLKDWRGITCDPMQVVITSGLADAIGMIARAVLNPGDKVLVEEPGHKVLRDALKRDGLEWIPGQVDDDGLMIDTERADIRAVALTPSRQFPLGMTMPLARRLRVLDWAERANGIVIEDDFDGEYRYQGQPIAALMSLDSGARVFYVGSFSKVLFPGLRLGFVVVPLAQLDRVRGALKDGPMASIVSQPVLARFIESGMFATHIRRMRRLYAHRQKVLVAEINRACRGLLKVQPSLGGMHLIAWMTPQLVARFDDKEAAARAGTNGVTVRALSGYYSGQVPRQGLVLGYAGFDDKQIVAAAQALAGALRK